MKVCEQCGHPFDPHKLIARGNPINEGLIVCPEDGCYCLASFDVPDRVTAEALMDSGVFHEGPSGSPDTIA